MKNALLLKFCALGVLAAFVAAPVQAKLAWNKKARAFDPGVIGCTSCHVNEKPKKKGEPLTERGQWMMDQQAKRQTKDIDLSWLKDYPKKDPPATQPLSKEKTP